MRTIRKPIAPRGFTLIELIVALIVAAILLGLAVSSASAAVQAVRSSDARTRLITSLGKARVAAIAKSIDVRMCPSADGATCVDGYHWESGWITYVDMNNNNAKDPGDLLIDAQERVGDGVHAITSTGRRQLEFQPNGTNAGSNTTFTLCDTRGHAKASAFAMSNAGTFRPVVPTATAIVEACR